MESEEDRTHWDGKMKKESSFDNVQYESVELCGQTIVLSGGRFPFSGGQSNYSSEVRGVDSTSFATRWIYTQPKNYPFRKMVVGGNVAGCMICQNFPRAATGVWLIDLESGELLASHHLNVVDIASNGNEIFGLVGALDNSFGTVLSLFPIVSTLCELPLKEHETLTSLDAYDDVILSVVEIEEKARNAYELSCRSRFDGSLRWRSVSRYDGLQVCERFLYRFAFAEKSKSIEVLDKATGQTLREIPIKSKGVSNIRELGNRLLLWVDDNDQLCIYDLEDESTRCVRHIGRIPGGIAVSYSSDKNSIFVLHSENHTGMNSSLFSMNIPSETKLI